MCGCLFSASVASEYTSARIELDHKSVNRLISQSCCPWNVKFSERLTERAFNARPAVADKDARTLARDLLQLSHAEFSAAFRNSPMKRAKLRGLQRTAVVVMGNISTDADLPLLKSMRQHDEPLLREHAAWTITRVRRSANGG